MATVERDRKLLLVAPGFGFTDEWRTAFAEFLPQVELVDPDDVEPDEPEIALVYDPPPGTLARFPRLRAVLALSAGVDGVLRDPTLPPVPLIRLAHHDIAQGMREYVAYNVLRLHRNFDRHEEEQRAAQWNWPLPSLPASDCRVSILGLGQTGLPTAILLQQIGYDVLGWTRRPRDCGSVPTLSGNESLKTLLARTDILVCLLPLTPATRGILGRASFIEMPRGACLINAARGACLVERDLLEALDAGMIRHATLDVFATEPLPASHPFWHHPGITVTPHAAANPGPHACAHAIGRVLEDLDRGRPPEGLVDRTVGY